MNNKIGIGQGSFLLCLFGFRTIAMNELSY